MHLLIANGALQGGGAERVVATLARGLRGIGHRVSIAALSSGGEVLDELVAQGFETLEGIGADRARGVLGAASRMRRAVADRGIDVVHTHDLRSLINVGLARRLGGRFRHVHTFHFGNYPHLPRKHIALERLFWRAPDQLVAVGHTQRETIVAALGVPHTRLVTIWNGVDAARADATGSQTAVPLRSDPLVGSVSAFFTQKGLEVLLEATAIALQQGARFRLLLVGDGPLRGALEAQSRRLGIDHVVEFAGWRPDAATSVLPTLDVFVQSSHWEAMSVVVLEAMAAGRPILATAVGDNPLVLQDGVTGMLVSPRNPQALAEGLVRMVGNEVLRRRLGEAARAAHQTTFTAGAMVRRYDELYRHLIG